MKKISIVIKIFCDSLGAFKKIVNTLRGGEHQFFTYESEIAVASLNPITVYVSEGDYINDGVV